MGQRFESRRLQAGPLGLDRLEQFVVVLVDAVAEVVAAQEAPDPLGPVSSREYGGRCTSVTFFGTFSALATCQPAWSSTSTTCIPAPASRPMNARCLFMY